MLHLEGVKDLQWSVEEENVKEVRRGGGTETLRACTRLKHLINSFRPKATFKNALKPEHRLKTWELSKKP